MAVDAELIVLDSRDQPGARCLVCGNDVAAGDGVTVQYQGRILRFKCPGCRARFEAAPNRYVAGHASDCCEDPDSSPPASEWICDR